MSFSDTFYTFVIRSKAAVLTIVDALRARQELDLALNSGVIGEDAFFAIAAPVSRDWLR